MWQTHKHQSCEWKVERNRAQNTEQVVVTVPENATCDVYNEYVKQEKKEKTYVNIIQIYKGYWQ